jgi:hypothetical protein
MNAIETLVLELIGEDTDSPDVFVDTSAGMAPIRDSINAGIQEVCMVLGTYTRTYHLVLLADRQFYRVAPKQDHFGYILEAYYRDQHRKLEQTNLQSLMKMDGWFLKTNATPTHYGHIGEDHVFVWPTPSAGGIVVELNAVMIPKAYTLDTDPIHARDQYRRSVALYAVSEFYASRGNEKRATRAWSEYLEVSGLALAQPQLVDRPTVMHGQLIR